MPRRRYQEDCRECNGYGCDECEANPDQPQEDDDVPAKASFHVPTLKEIRQHIKAHAWNGGECRASMSNEEVFSGQCEYASTAISEMLTGTGKNSKPVDWSLRVRGWYSGDLSQIKTSHGCDPHAFAFGKHCHSWVEYKGVIIDPTFWQFAGDPVRVYVFSMNDPRYHRDEHAESQTYCDCWEGDPWKRFCTLCKPKS